MNFMMILPRVAIFGVLISFFGFYFKHNGAQAQTFNGITSESLGGAGRAAVDGLDVGRLNPAGLVHLRSYVMGTNYRERQLTRELSSSSWNLSIADGSSGVAFPGAFTYERTLVYGGGDRLDQEHYFGSVAQRIRPTVGLGLTVHHRTSRNSVGGRVGVTQADLGILWTPRHFLGLGLVGYNLAGLKSGLEDNRSNLARTLGVGSQLLMGELLRVRADYLHQIEENPGERGHLMLGLESLAFEWIVLRAGWQENGIGETGGWSAGFGFNGPRLKLNYSAQFPRESGREARHGIDLFVEL